MLERLEVDGKLPAEEVNKFIDSFSSAKVGSIANISTSNPYFKVFLKCEKEYLLFLLGASQRFPKHLHWQNGFAK